MASAMLATTGPSLPATPERGSSSTTSSVNSNRRWVTPSPSAAASDRQYLREQELSILVYPLDDRDEVMTLTTTIPTGSETTTTPIGEDYGCPFDEPLPSLVVKECEENFVDGDEGELLPKDTTAAETANSAAITTTSATSSLADVLEQFRHFEISSSTPPANVNAAAAAAAADPSGDDREEAPPQPTALFAAAGPGQSGTGFLQHPTLLQENACVSLDGLSRADPWNGMSA